MYVFCSLELGLETKTGKIKLTWLSKIVPSKPMVLHCGTRSISIHEPARNADSWAHFRPADQQLSEGP